MLSAQKGIEYLIDALAELSASGGRFTLDLVGDGPLRAELEALARARLPAGVVRFHGALPRPEVARLMARSDAFVLPTVAETFGVVVIEALAAGLPVITTTAVPDHDRITKGGMGIVVPPRDVAALRDAVSRMVREGWDMPLDRARDLAWSFSESAIGARWDEIYRSLASR
jgi:glycosyltransferase involved in cell wall biosynthesis